MGDIIAIIKSVASKCNIDPNLAMAIATQESSLDPNKSRFEPNWSYLYKVDDFANSLGITSLTEKNLQSMSWGLMQVMGSVARELGYSDQIPKLIDPSLGALYGCKKLATLCKIYKDENDVISAYNQGKPFKGSDGHYKNDLYVIEVSETLSKLRKADKPKGKL